ncbi:glycoside hydrolase family 3 protein [Solilutibacter silvestris]|uniref:Glycosyl hydrolase family 3 N terminal domain n=1 Tax=Solilutibacter silvestris TaxID=1645665 RepID=A0A2K1PX45_9GAMM|nr:glycoside hydrolase family 3 N-terminal domain-containing protein [Lysobacter silvestris]PNS07363.1 Glycosyl hydrolase family 3 N terminal domain [Lysobacter silvestris]
MKRALAIAVVAGLMLPPVLAGQNSRDTATLHDWPRVHSAVAKDAAIEARVREILASMTLAQKIGQMTQPEIKTITPDEVRRYYIGSVLNGGGSWSRKNKHADARDWLALADAYHAASMGTDAKVPIPIIWGTDAVHGHSNVFGATTFPHNIGLGAARDPEMIHEIGAATARATRATGIDWAFSPTLAVVQNPRWGRSYESFSSDGMLVKQYGEAYVRGMQGDLRGDGTTIATAKHFIGDGSTDNGKDQGISTVSRAEMLNVHAQGYYGALAGGVQTVMASYNSWNDRGDGIDYGKMHGAKALLTDALKQKMGFDGFIVSDWNAIGQLPGCTNDSCAKAINAGVDMVMVPDDWKAFIANTTKQVERGEIPVSRIDDAVSRILRVKLRAGLFTRKPSDSSFAGKSEALQARALARRAVRESLVLLKNERGLLPLHRGQRILVVGKTADSIPNQTGGWSLTWQGSDNSNADFPNAQSILSGLREAAGDDRVIVSTDGRDVDPSKFDAVVAVIGETPYAETNGDIVSSDTVTHSRRFPEDLAALKTAHASGKPVVTVFVAGRPLYTNDLMNLSDAFVAAWLPGTEGGGVADVLFARNGAAFRGRLGFPWPSVPCPAPINHPDAKRPWLFKVGYGLRYGQKASLQALPVSTLERCGDATVLPIFNMADAPMFALYVGADGKDQALGGDLNRVLRWPADKPAVEIATVQVNTQQDAKQVTWLAPASFFSRNPSRNNLAAMQTANAALLFDVVVRTVPKSPVLASMQCGAGCKGKVDISEAIAAAGIGQKKTIKIPLACFAKAGADMPGIEEPFHIDANAPFSAAFANIRVVSGAAADQDAVKCAR